MWKFLVCTLLVLVVNVSFGNYDDYDFDEIDLGILEDFDEDEFEGIHTDDDKENDEAIPLVKKKNNYYMEMGFIIFILAYIINYLVGISINKALAVDWITQFTPLFKEEFKEVGSKESLLLRESQHTYKLICTGRKNCAGIQANIRLNRRYDLVSRAQSFFSPSSDLIDIQVALEDSTDPFVFALASSYEGRTMQKDLEDVKVLARMSKIEGLSENYTVASEFKDISTKFLRDFRQVLNTHTDQVKLIYISDQSLQHPTYTKVARFVYNLPQKNRMEEVEKLLKMTFIMIDKISEIRLDKNQKKKSIDSRNNLNKEQRKQAMEERQEELQKKKYENATPEQIEKWKRKEKKKRTMGKMKVVH